MHKKFWDVERGVTYIPWAKVKVEELDTYREGGILDEETFNPGKVALSQGFLLFVWQILFQTVPLCPFSVFFFPAEWNRSKDQSQQALVNGALESLPVDGAITAHMQVMMMQFLKRYGLN